MAKEIRQLPEVTAPATTDWYILQKSSNNQTSKISGANLIPDGSVTNDALAGGITASKFDVTLYSGTATRVVTLSEAYTNFKRLIITYTWGVSTGTIVCDTSLSSIDFPVVQQGQLSGVYKVIIGAGEITFSGTTATGSNAGETYSIICTSASAISFSDAINDILISKVIGIRT